MTTLRTYTLRSTAFTSSTPRARHGAYLTSSGFSPALAGCRLFQMPGISGVMPSGKMQEQPNPVSSTGRRGWEGLPAIDGQRCKIEVQACLRKDNHPQKALRRPVLDTGLGFSSTFRLGMMLELPTLWEQGARQAKGGNPTEVSQAPYQARGDGASIGVNRRLGCERRTRHRL